MIKILRSKTMKNVLPLPSLLSQEMMRIRKRVANKGLEAHGEAPAAAAFHCRANHVGSSGGYFTLLPRKSSGFYYWEQ